MRDRTYFYNKIPKADSCCCCYCYISTLTKCRTYSFRIGVSYYHSLRTGTSNLVPRLRGDNQVWDNLVTLGSQKKVVPVIIDTKVISFLVISNKPFLSRRSAFANSDRKTHFMIKVVPNNSSIFALYYKNTSNVSSKIYSQDIEAH